MKIPRIALALLLMGSLSLAGCIDIMTGMAIHAGGELILAGIKAATSDGTSNTAPFILHAKQDSL